LDDLTLSPAILIPPI